MKTAKKAIRAGTSPKSSAPPKSKKFQCQICFEISSTQAAYINHILMAHSNPEDEEDEEEEQQDEIPEESESQDEEPAQVDDQIQSTDVDEETVDVDDQEHQLEHVVVDQEQPDEEEDYTDVGLVFNNRNIKHEEDDVQQFEVETEVESEVHSNDDQQYEVAEHEIAQEEDVEDHEQQQQQLEENRTAVEYITVPNKEPPAYKVEHVEIPRNGKVTTCPDCKKEYKTPMHFRIHWESNCGKDKKYHCGICNAKFITHASLKAHMLIHVGEKKFQCSCCPKSFLSQGQLKVHMRHHTSEKPFACTQCPKSFAHRESLVTHSSIHTGIRPYVCLNCDHRFSCIGNLIKHRKTRKDSCGLPQFCTNSKVAPRANTKIPGTLLMAPLPTTHRRQRTEEDSPFASPTRPQKRRRAKKEKNFETIMLDTMNGEEQEEAPLDEFLVMEYPSGGGGGGQSDGQGQLIMTVNDAGEEVEEQMVVTEEEEEEQLQQQGLEQGDPENYIIEINQEEAEGQDVHEHQEAELHQIEDEPEDEEEQAMAIEDAILHEGPRTGRRQRPVQMKYGDDICMVSYEHDQDESNIIEMPHPGPSKIKAMDATVGIRYDCTKCLKSFALEKTLQKHEMSNCGRTTEHLCEICHKGYATAATLRMHMSCHNDVRPYNCAHCDKKFRTALQVQVHTRVHTGEKPYKCDQCPRQFGHRETLLTHQSIHTGYKRFLCINCGDRFSCISNLQSHRRARKDTCGAQPAHTRPVGENEDIRLLMIGGVIAVE